MATNAVYLKDKAGNVYYPVTDVSLVTGLQEGAIMESVIVDSLPTASSSTVGKIYMIESETEGEYDRYLTTYANSAYTWTQLGSTAIQSPTIADNLTTNDATKALSAKQGKVLNESLSQLDLKVDEKLDKSAGTNLVDPSMITLGKGIRHDGTTIQDLTNGGLSDYIPVNGQDISTNALFNAYWGGAVYDADKTFLRALSASPYVYQDGDAYIRLSFGSSFIATPMANYGDTLGTYVPYTPIGGYLVYTENEISNLQNDVTTLQAHPYIPNAPEGARKALLALYLEGLDTTIDYYVSTLSMNASGQVTMYIRRGSDAATMALADSFEPYNGIVRLRQASNSGVKGYALVNLSAGESYVMVVAPGRINLANAAKYDYPFKDIYASDCLVDMGKGYPNVQESLLLKAVKAIKIMGNGLSGNYAVRLLSKNNNTIMIVSVDGTTGGQVASYTLNVDLSGNTLKHITATITGMTLDALIDLSVIPDGGSINLYDAYYNWWIKPENVISTSSAPTEGDNNPITSSAVATALASIDPEAEDYMVEVAKGLCASKGTYASELDASPLIADTSEYNVGFDKVLSKNDEPVRKDIIMFNHDDGAMPDLVATRKIYNKYGFKGSFCMILEPFGSLSSAQSRIANGRKLLKDGHEMGLHAIINVSYWDADRHFDVTPSGGSLFAPKVDELKGSNPDGTGVNTFGKTITEDTLVRNIYSTSSIYDDGLFDVKVVDLTQSQVDTINSEYCFYSDKYTQNGIDDLALADIMKASSATTLTKTRLQWLEYWYNGLIDDTLGYSSTESTLAAKFAEDYDVPSGASAADYYPDAAHMLNGKMVYYGDTSNPHYNDSSYQKVGRFTKGLYKGCFSTCNWEVMSRIVEVAQAFFRKYFGTDHFTDQHLHGVGYIEDYYKNSDGICFLNREKTIPVDKNGLFYSTRIGAFISKSEIFAGFRCNILKETERRLHIRLNGQRGNYYGVGKIKSPWNYGGHDGRGDMTDYLAMFGTTTYGMETMSYSDFMTFMNGVDDWLKFCYDNAGQSVTRNGLTMNVYSYIKNVLTQVLSVKGTGKIPMISVDTLLRSPAIVMAMDLLFRTFKKLGYQVVSFEQGLQKILEQPRNTSGNLFPNYGFEQTLLQLVGESDIQSKVPDGWRSFNSLSSLAVSSETIDNETCQVLTIGQGGLSTLIYGLPEGAYQFKVWAKTANGQVSAFLEKNGDIVDSDQHQIIGLYPTSEWVEYTEDIYIPAQYRKAVDASDPVSVICDGCQDNVRAIKFAVQAYSGQTLSIAKPRLFVK